LHDPTITIKAKSEREKRLILFRRTIDAESLARYCIKKFLTNKSLWSYSVEDANLSRFCGLTSDERQRIWGGILDINAISSSFDHSHLKNNDLGLQGIFSRFALILSVRLQ